MLSQFQVMLFVNFDLILCLTSLWSEFCPLKDQRLDEST